MTELPIRIDLTTAPIQVVTNDNPRRGVRRGDTVVWLCQSRAAGQGLQVRLGNPHPFTGALVAGQDEIRGIISQTVQGGAVFTYDLLDRNGTRLGWANGSNTGVIEIMDPP